jgi:hypothetical protein
MISKVACYFSLCRTLMVVTSPFPPQWYYSAALEDSMPTVSQRAVRYPSVSSGTLLHPFHSVFQTLARSPETATRLSEPENNPHGCNVVTNCSQRAPTTRPITSFGFTGFCVPALRQKDPPTRSSTCYARRNQFPRSGVKREQSVHCWQPPSGSDGTSVPLTRAIQ